MMTRAKSVNAWAHLCGALALGIPAQILLWSHGSGPHPLWRQLTGWGLMALGGWLLHRAWQGQGEAPASAKALAGKPSKASAWPRWVEASALGLLFALALGLRLVNLEHYPNAGFRDEGENGNVSIQIIKGEKVSSTGTKLPSYIEDVSQNAAGYFYLSALSLRAFGVSMLSMRYTGVFFGVLSVLLFYAVARSMLGLPLALAAALCMAGLRWNLNFSRTALLGIHTMATSLPVMYFLWRGLQAPDPSLKPARRRAGKELLLWLGLAIAYLSYNFDLSAWGGLDSPLSWLGFFVRVCLHVPIAVAVWQARHEPRSRSFAIMGAALGFCLYSYLASRLVLISVLAVWAGFFLRAQGFLQGKAGRALALSLAAFFGGILAIAVAATLANASSPALRLAGFGLMGLGALGLAWAFFSALRGPGSYANWVRPLAIGVAGCWLMAAPLLNYMVTHRGQMLSRTQRVWVWGNEDYDPRGWGPKLLESVSRTLGMVNVEGDGNPRHNDPGRPMFNPLLATLFGLGAFLVLLRLDRPLPLFLFLWLHSHWLASYVGIESPQAFRGLCSMAPAVLIACYALLPLGSALRQELGSRWRGGLTAFFCLLMAVSVAWDGYDYFVNQPKHPGVWSEFSAGEYEMGARLRKMQPERGGKRVTIGLFRADWADSWTTKFTAYPERRYQSFDLVQHVPLDPAKAQPNTDYYYVLDDAYLPLKPLLQRYYPHGQAEDYRHPITNELVFWSFLAPAEDIAATRTGSSGLKAQYFNSREDGKHWQAQDLAFKRVDPFVLFNWTVAPISGHFSVLWTGQVKAPSSGHYLFHAFSNNRVELRIDGKKVLERNGEQPGDRWTDGRVELDAGWHAIDFRYAETRNYSRVELWWTPPGADKSVVPGDALRPE